MTDRFEKAWLEENTDFEIPAELLEGAFEELPPEAVIDASNPCTVGMNNIIVGTALNCVTINILALNHILPAIGSIMLLLGFRNLRGENLWFRIGYICSILRLATVIPVLILNATVYNDILQGTAGNVFLTVTCAIQIVMIFSLWRALSLVQDKAGVKEKSSSAGALFIWYVVLLIAGTVGIAGTLTAILMIVSFVIIVACLVSVSKMVGTTGYAITPSPIKVEDGVLVKAILGVIAVGIIAGYTFFSAYDMKWEPAVQGTDSDNAVYGKLVELGYPEEQLQDLSADELELLKDADCVVVKQEEKPLNSGVEKTEHEAGGTQIYTEYPDKELKLTHVAVRIAGDGSQGELWRVIHHFALDDEYTFRGTANIQLWPLESMEGWKDTKDMSGRLFCTMKGQNMEADFYSMGRKNYDYTDFFGTVRNTTDCMFDFSMPRKASHRRGYTAYTSKQVENGWLLSSWANYTVQTGRVQYPVKTADTNVREGMHIRDYPFRTAQSAIQFYVSDGAPDWESLEGFMSE